MSGGSAGGAWEWNGQEWVWWDGTEWLTADQVAESAELPPPPPQADGVSTPVAQPTVPQSAVGTAVAPANVASGRRGLSGGGITAIILGVVLVLVLVGSGIAFVMTRMGGDDGDVVTLQTEPLSTASSPFTPPMGTDTPVASPVPVTGVQNVSAQTEGLFGGTLDNSSCDKAALVAFLQANPDKAGPWAQTLGITAAQIPSFVEPLTPVLLRSDTAVTNHGFENGQITVVPAVLQAGTAVLVNQYGQPVVKCYCGNPLTPPPPMNRARYTGPRWPTFVPGAMTVVAPTTVIIQNFTLVDVVTNVTFVRAAGTAGAQDTVIGDAAVPTPTPTPIPTPTATQAPLPTQPALPTQEPLPTFVPPEPTYVPPVEGGREGAAIAAVQDRYRVCASAMGSSEGVEEVIAQASFDAAPVGTEPGAYTVNVSDVSGLFVYYVNLDTGEVAATSADAIQVADACPGVFD